jgi:hypothetical protein
MTHLGQGPSDVLSSFAASDDKCVVTLSFGHECLLGALDSLVSAQKRLRQALFGTIDLLLSTRLKHALLIHGRGRDSSSFVAKTWPELQAIT